MPPPRSPPQPTRFAIQKARGKGWTTLEVGETRAHLEARFRLMIKLNPRAYFRMIQLDYNPDASSYDEMEFNWTLIELYDPSKGSAGRAPSRGASRAPRRPGGGSERVRIPVRTYLAVLLIGVLAGFALLFLHGPRPPG